jgi:lipid II:glycine glycyltransferase (peptidoglycan interpeptide bridge formation enzyme)
MKGYLIGSNDPRWLAALERCRHDVYQRPEWAEFHSRINNAKACAVIVENDQHVLLCPVEYKVLDPARWDAGSPYGYPGPVCSTDDQRTFGEMLLTVAHVLRSEGAVTWFVRFHPLLNALSSVGIGHFVHHGSTVAIDLEKSLEQQWRETRSGHRSDIQRSEKLNIAVEQSRSVQDHAAFARVYAETMHRVMAADFYHFAEGYSVELEQALGPDMQLWVARDGAEVIAASIFTTCRSSGIVQYHLSGTTGGALGVQPSKLILQQARCSFKSAGFRWMHLGGGLGSSDDGLFRFKRGFSPITWPFETLRVVLDSSEYNRRCNLAGTYRGSDRYFPPYRQPS